MSKPNPAALLGLLIAVLVVMVGLTLAKGGLYIGKHEGDALHSLNIVARMAAGQRIHQDFETPLGVLAFLPILPFVKMGFGIGHAMIYAQALVGVLMLPAIFWMGWTRLSGTVAYVACGYIMVLAVALVFGAAEASASMSMQYNRWAWVLAYLAILLAVLPSNRDRSQGLDGVIIGLAMACLLLLKVTYFAAFAVPVMVSLLMRGAWRTVFASVIAGLAVLALATVWGGFGFWQGYIDNLRLVSTSGVRSAPGASLGNLITAPEFFGINLLLLSGVVLLRQIRQERAGLILLLLVPGFVYVTYQNAGNDPQWLVLLFVLLMTLRPDTDMTNDFGWNMRGAMNIAAGIALAFAAPSFVNLAYSPYRHFQLNTATYVPIIPGDALNSDLQSDRTRVMLSNGLKALDLPGTGLEVYSKGIDRGDPVIVNGEVLPPCQVERGLSALMATIANDLTARGYGGRAIYEADLLELLPVFGDFPAYKGGSPWYYGGTPGIENADLVMVPMCAIKPVGVSVRLKSLEAAGIKLKELYRTPVYILLEKVKEG